MPPEIALSDNNLISISDINDLRDLLYFIEISTGNYVHKQSDSIFYSVDMSIKSNKSQRSQRSSNNSNRESTPLSPVNRESTPLSPVNDVFQNSTKVAQNVKNPLRERTSSTLYPVKNILHKEVENGKKDKNKKMQKVWLSNVQTISEDKQTTISNPKSLVLSRVRQTRGSYPLKVGFGDIDLLTFHNKKLALYVDKYLFTAIPDIQTEFLLESVGIPQDRYEADLDPRFMFNVNACFDNDLVNEFVTPRIRGGSFNPYVRFLSSKSSGGGQVLKLFDLVGLNPDDDSLISPCFDLLTLTFPFEISKLLLDSKIRNSVTEKMFKCYIQFFKELHLLFDIPSNHILGSSISLHEWSSNLPFLPHAHFHIVLPHFSYKKINKSQRLQYESLIDLPDSSEYGGLEFEKGRLYSRLYDLIVEFELTHNKMPKFKKHDLFSPQKESSPEGILFSHCDKKQFHRSISDMPEFQAIYNDISSKLSSMLEFSVLDWQGLIQKKSFNGDPCSVRVPFDVDLLRSIWTDIVNDVFALNSPNDISLDYSDPVMYDIFIEFVSINSPKYFPKLLHFLSYKSRPAILDLDLFFKNCDGFVLDHNHIDKNRVLLYVRNLKHNAETYENFDDFYRYESVLSKIEKIFDLFSDRAIFDWLRFLSTHRTITKTFGFWRNIKRYRVSSVQYKAIPYPKICSICGNPTCIFRFTNSLTIDGLILHHGSKFYLFNIDKPPPPKYC